MTITQSNKLFIYDSNTNQWTQGTNLPAALGALTANFINVTLYVVGGVDPEKKLASTLAYDPATDKWTEKAPMSTARHGLAAVSLVTRYVIGGGPQPGGSAGSLNEIFHVNGGR